MNKNCYIKAFDKNLKCRNFQYDTGMTYSISGNLEICKNGFHFSDNLCDTLNYYFADSRYCIVEPLGQIIHNENKYATDKIKIIRELSLKELINLDTTGEWIFEFAKRAKNIDIKPLQNRLIEIDTTGEWLFEFASRIKGADINRIEQRILEVDTTGEWIMNFAYCIKSANLQSLQNRLLEVDANGKWLYCFAKFVKNADVNIIRKQLMLINSEWQLS